MTEGRQKKQVTDGVERTDTELVVTVRRTGFLKRHRPEFPVSPLAQQELEAGIGDWGKVMIRAMREVLYARAIPKIAHLIKRPCLTIALNTQCFCVFASTRRQLPDYLTVKKRKPSYLVHKVGSRKHLSLYTVDALLTFLLLLQEENKTLKDQVLQLEAQVAVLKTRGMPAGSSLAADPGLQQSKAKTKADATKQQRLGIASAQSLMTEAWCTRIICRKT
ncbi:hypothetical protein GQ600_12355 [Phytophthora cactorum]|nr:hypothetical protein GQ600_12355 [Phytophthora cactorum]